LKKLQLVEVEWEDTAGGSNWADTDDDYTKDTIQCKTAGYLLKSNRKTLVIASTITQKDRCTDRTIIPRSVVKSINRR